MKKKTQLVQTILKRKNLYQGAIDGIAGPKTLKGLTHFEQIDPKWSVRRKITAAVQIFALEENIPASPVDGHWGPITEEAYNQLFHKIATGHLPEMWRPEEIADLNPNRWPKQYTPIFDKFYGAPGSSLVSVALPYPHKIAWKPSQTIHSFKCHKKVKESIERILGKVLEEYGLEEIRRLRLDQWGGCFNKRLIRNGTKWSTHSWGISIDYDPANNKLNWGRDKARFARPEYARWWQLWEEEGWVSLGRKANFDWMHLQAAKL